MIKVDIMVKVSWNILINLFSKAIFIMECLNTVLLNILMETFTLVISKIINLTEKEFGFNRKVLLKELSKMVFLNTDKLIILTIVIIKVEWIIWKNLVKIVIIVLQMVTNFTDHLETMFFTKENINRKIKIWFIKANLIQILKNVDKENYF